MNLRADDIKARNARTNRLIVAMVAIGVVALVTLASVGLYYSIRSSSQLLSIARDNRSNGDQIKEALHVLDGATGPDAQARQAQVLNGAITDLRRSMDCVLGYALGNRPPACADVDARLDTLLAGGDPFRSG